MPEFFFSIQDGDRIIPAEEALEMPSIDAAIAEAQIALADMVRDELPDGPKLRMKVIVEDERRREVYRAALKLDDETGRSYDSS